MPAQLEAAADVPENQLRSIAVELFGRLPVRPGAGGAWERIQRCKGCNSVLNPAAPLSNC